MSLIRKNLKLSMNNFLKSNSVNIASKKSRVNKAVSKRKWVQQSVILQPFLHKYPDAKSFCKIIETCPPEQFKKIRKDISDVLNKSRQNRAEIPNSMSADIIVQSEDILSSLQKICYETECLKTPKSEFKRKIKNIWFTLEAIRKKFRVSKYSIFRVKKYSNTKLTKRKFKIRYNSKLPHFKAHDKFNLVSQRFNGLALINHGMKSLKIKRAVEKVIRWRVSTISRYLQRIEKVRPAILYYKKKYFQNAHNSRRRFIGRRYRTKQIYRNGRHYRKRIFRGKRSHVGFTQRKKKHVVKKITKASILRFRKLRYVHLQRIGVRTFAGIKYQGYVRLSLQRIGYKAIKRPITRKYFKACLRSWSKCLFVGKKLRRKTFNRVRMIRVNNPRRQPVSVQNKQKVLQRQAVASLHLKGAKLPKQVQKEKNRIWHARRQLKKARKLQGYQPKRFNKWKNVRRIKQIKRFGRSSGRKLPTLIERKGKLIILIVRGDRKILRPLKISDLLPKDSWWKTRKGQRKFRKIRCNAIRYRSRYIIRPRTKFDHSLRRASRIFRFDRRIGNYLQWFFVDRLFKLTGTSLPKLYASRFASIKDNNFFGFQTHRPLRWGQIYSKKHFFTSQIRSYLITADLIPTGNFISHKIVNDNYLPTSFIDGTEQVTYNRYLIPTRTNKKYRVIQGRNFSRYSVFSRRQPPIFRKNTFTGNIKNNSRLRAYLAIRYQQLI